MKWAHKAKILRVFESCETYAQWNNAFDWFSNYIKPNTSSVDDRIYLLENIEILFYKKKLKHTHVKTPGLKKFDN